jgi:hypothetical protein
MDTTANDAAKLLPSKDFLLRDYELKARYLTDHFGRMWTRFNYFVGIESALIGGNLIFGNGKLSAELAIVGAIVSLVWYVMGAEDRFLVRVYRGHVKSASDLLAKEVWDATTLGPYRHAGEVAASSKELGWELSGWRWNPISTTRLAAWIPLAALLAWSGLLLLTRS